MGFFSNLFSSKNLEEELKGLKKAQEILDERFNKKQVPNEVYTKKSLEYRLKIEKIEKKLNKNN